MRIAHLNCRSLLSHKDDILDLTNVLHLDILSLSETWLDDTVSDDEIVPVDFGYSLFRRDRNRHGGGVAILLSNCIPFCPHLDLSGGQIESIWGELYPRSKRSLLLCCAYRPPSKMDFYDHFMIECENGVQRSQKMLLLGDLNSDTLSTKLPECRLLQSFSSSFGLQDMFVGPTRVTESTSSHLDVFLTNSVFSFTDVTALPVGFSNHHIVVGTYLTRRSHQPSGHKFINVRSYRKLDPNLLCTIYSDDAWNDVFSFDNVSDTVECFTAVLQGVMDLLIPTHKIRIKQHLSPWAASPDILTARHARDKLHRQALCTGDPVIWQQYRCARNKVNKLLRNAKHTYLSQLVSSTAAGSREFWSNFRYLSRKGSQPSGLVENLDFAADDLNNHFLSIADKLASGLPRASVSPLSFCSEASSTFHLSEVLESEVISILSITLGVKRLQVLMVFLSDFLKLNLILLGDLLLDL